MGIGASDFTGKRYSEGVNVFFGDGNVGMGDRSG